MKNKILTIIRVVLALTTALIIVYGLFYCLPTLLALFITCLLGIIIIDISEQDI